MSSPRQVVREYMEASENLMKLKDLTYTEMDIVQEMLDRLSKMLTSTPKDET